MGERLQALAVAVRRPALDAMRESERRYQEQDAKRLYYLSMEFLMGRALGNNLTNLGLYDDAKSILSELGSDLEEIAVQEPDAALGNGGLGRLAACFLDSLATMDMPGFGYGINYEFGLFRQTFVNGFQHEKPDHWLDDGGSPWLIERTDEAVIVPVYGSIAHTTVGGVYKPSWVDYKVIVGVPFDMPIVGYGGRTVNYLRLYSARASREVDRTGLPIRCEYGKQRRRGGRVTRVTICRSRAGSLDFQASSRRRSRRPWWKRMGLPATVWSTPSSTHPSPRKAKLSGRTGSPAWVMIRSRYVFGSASMSS